MSSTLETAVLAAHAIIKSRLSHLTEAERFSFKLLIQPVVEELPAYHQALQDEKVANELSMTDELPLEEVGTDVEALQLQVRDLAQRLQDETVHYSTLARERNSLFGEKDYWERKAKAFEEDARRNHLDAKFFVALKAGYNAYFDRVPRGLNPYPVVEDHHNASFYWNMGWDTARELFDLREKTERQDLAYKALGSAYREAKAALPLAPKPKKPLEIAMDSLELRLSEAETFARDCTDFEVIEHWYAYERRITVRRTLAAKLKPFNDARYGKLPTKDRLEVDSLFRGELVEWFENLSDRDKMLQLPHYTSLTFLHELQGSSRLSQQFSTILANQVTHLTPKSPTGKA